MKKTMYLLIMAIAFEIYKIAKLRKDKKINQKLAALIQGLEILNVSHLKEKVKNGVHKIGDIVLCSGKISCPELLNSILSPKNRIVYSELILDKTFQFRNTTNSITKKIRTQHPSYLKLVDKDNSFVNIYQTFSTKMLSHHLQRKINFYRQRIFNFGWIISLFVQSPTHTVSTVFTQNYIPDNSEAIVLGQIQQQELASQVIKNFSSIGMPQLNNLYINRPMFVASSKSYLLSYIHSLLDTIKFQTFMYGFLLMGTIYFLMRIYIIPKLRSILTQRRQKANDPQSLDKVYINNRQCEKCDQKLGNIISCSCKHMAICDECYENDGGNGQNIVCPLCSYKGIGTIKVFPC